MRVLLLAFLLSACAGRPVSAPLQAQAPACAATRFPLNERIGAWSVDKFAGRYTREGEGLPIAIRREEHRLLVDRPGLGTRELTADTVESWTWRDGCGSTYAFTLPPDGPGAWLTVTDPGGGTSKEWHRVGY